MDNPRLKINILCASRGNHSGLRTIIGALDALASGKHDISYVIASDIDDMKTRYFDAHTETGIQFFFSHSMRGTSLGAKWNEAANFMLADIYVLVTDRSLCVTPLWDVYLADAYDKDDARVTWWTTNAGPVIPIVPHKWYEAAGNKIFTDYFPFWFDDTWLQQVSALVHGLPCFLSQATCYVSKKNVTTKRFRDLRFWMDFFIAKEPERYEVATKIRAALGIPCPDLRPIEVWFKDTYAMWDKEWQRWEQLMGDKSEPDESYLKAKKRAEEMMKKPLLLDAEQCGLIAANTLQGFIEKQEDVPNP